MTRRGETVLGDAVQLRLHALGERLTLLYRLAVTDEGVLAVGEAVGLLLAVAELAVLVVGEQIAAAQRTAAQLGAHRVGDDVLGEVEHLLELAGRQVQQRADLAGDVLDVPDVGAGGGELDVAHAVAAYGRLGDLDAAALAHLAGEALAAVLAAGALPVLLGSEDALIEQAVALRLEGAVVDRLRLRDLAVAPATDPLGRGDADLHAVELSNLFHSVRSPRATSGGRTRRRCSPACCRRRAP